MSGRDVILNAIRQGRGEMQSATSYQLPPWTADCVVTFMVKAKASFATVSEIASPGDAPEAIWSILSEKKSAHLHLPTDSALHALPWNRAPGVALSSAPPSGEDSAFAAADWAIAETGTLVFLSGPRKPSSWHFRPGLEIVMVTRASILPRFESVLAEIAKTGAMPATVNLVTGPSRTADVEQTMELGAHGPRALHILIAG